MKIKEISPIDFYKIYNSYFNVLVIDIRSNNEYDLYHIKNSVNVPYSVLIKKPHLFLNKDKHYYIIDKDCSNSSVAVRILSSIGYNVTAVIGGIKYFKGDFVSKEYVI